MQELLALEPRPSAVFAANDLMALGAINAVRKAGLGRPEDVAVVGFDDLPIAVLVSPARTTVRQFKERAGRRAAELLLERVGGAYTGSGRVEAMPFELVVRGST